MWKAVSPGALYGHGFLLRIGQISQGTLPIEPGAPYPALFRPGRLGFRTAHKSTSENNRRTKFHELSSPGRGNLRRKEEGSNHLVTAIASALGAEREET